MGFQTGKVWNMDLEANHTLAHLSREVKRAIAMVYHSPGHALSAIKPAMAAATGTRQTLPMVANRVPSAYDLLGPEQEPTTTVHSHAVC